MRAAVRRARDRDIAARLKGLPAEAAARGGERIRVRTLLCKFEGVEASRIYTNMKILADFGRKSKKEKLR